MHIPVTITVTENSGSGNKALVIPWKAYVSVCRVILINTINKVLIEANVTVARAQKPGLR